MLTVTATDLPRLMACNGSRLLGGFTPPSGDDSVRDEGNAADWLVSQIHAGAAVANFIDKKAPNGVYITVEMTEYLEEYLKTVGTVADGTLVQVDTSLEGDAWSVNGRADLQRYDAPAAHLHVGDLKYGWGIVEPENDWTLIAHALGWVIRNPTLPLSKITFTIYQPRPQHPIARVRSWTISGERLMQFYYQLDKTLSQPDDKLNTGKHCYRCPRLAICPAARMASMLAVDISERAYVDEVDNDTLSFTLDQLTRAIEVLTLRKKASEELAMHRVRSGQIVKNYMIDSQLTNRQWYDYVTPEILEGLTGLDLTKKELITPTQVEKSGVHKEVVAAFVERRNKGIKLVRVDLNAKAEKMFNSKNGEI